MKNKVAVIGGGPAGSTAATILARKGIEVVLFEKETFPRPHIGESLLPFCYHIFKETGVLPEIERSFSRKPGAAFLSADGSNATKWCFAHVIKNESYLSFHVNRAEFDKVLLDHARSSGVQVFENRRVTGVSTRADGTSRVETMSDGKSSGEEFGFVLDCSGQDAFFGNRLNTKIPYKGLTRTGIACHWTDINYDEGLNEGLIEIVFLGGEAKAWIWLIPLDINLLSVGVTMDASYIKEYRNKNTSTDWAVKLYDEQVAGSAQVSRVLRKARKTEAFFHAADFSYYQEKPYGKGYACVGDANAFLDPIFSSGVYLAMKSASLVANKLADNLNGNQAPDLHFQKVYDSISGAYEVIESFIRIFYDPESAGLSAMGAKTDDTYRSYENAYALVHWLLAGDFFADSDRYLEFMKLFRNRDFFAKWKNYNASQDKEVISCGEESSVIYPNG